MEKVTFNSSGQKLTGTLLIPQKLNNKNPGVLLIHGFTSSEKNYLLIAEKLVEKGIVALTINLRGHNNARNEESIFVKDGFIDGLSAYDFLTAHDFIDKEKIGLCGASFGGGISAYISGERRVKSLVLRVPATYDEHLMRLSLKDALSMEGSKFNNMQNLEQTAPIQNLKKFTGDLLVIESENDSIIPERMIQAFFDAPQNPSSKDLVIMKSVGHDLTEEKRHEFRNLALSWFEKTL